MELRNTQYAALSGAMEEILIVYYSIMKNHPTLSASKQFLLIIFANSLDPDQARKNVQPDLDPNCLAHCAYS